MGKAGSSPEGMALLNKDYAQEIPGDPKAFYQKVIIKISHGVFLCTCVNLYCIFTIYLVVGGTLVEARGQLEGGQSSASCVGSGGPLR